MGLINMSNSTFLYFIKHINEVAALNAKKMEELIYEDPASAIVKARLFAEELLSDVFRKEEITAPYVSSLYDKITFLANEGYIKKEIQLAFEAIRMTGNKAAHDGRYNDVNAALKLHKVMYDIAVWFFEVYSLEQIKIPPYEHPKPPKYSDNIEDLVKKQLMELIGSKITLPPEDRTDLSTSKEQEITESPEEPILKLDLAQGESYLLRELKRLQDSAQEAVENANRFSRFKEYMHVKRKIQMDFEQMLENNKDKPASLILLCGSVGDGKSHLLAYLKEHRHDLMSEYEIYNDATESFSPDKNAMETLEEVLRDFSDKRIEGSSKKIILAINMGVLHNFIYRESEELAFERLKDFIINSELFSQKITTTFSEGVFNLISFGDYQPFELTVSGPRSSFFLELLRKVFDQSEQNPFYLAYKTDQSNGVRSIIHENFEFMQDPIVQKQVVNIIIQTLVKDKLVISARAFLNFVADILIPDKIEEYVTDLAKLESTVPSLLFGRKERSAILAASEELDPIHIRSPHMDRLIIELHTLNDLHKIIEDYVASIRGKEWIQPFIHQENFLVSTLHKLSETIIRIAYLSNEEFAQKVQEESYRSYVENLYYFNKGDRRKIRDFYEEVKSAIYKWKGSPMKDFIYLDRPSEQFRLAQSLNLKPSIEHLLPNMNDVLDSFKPVILLGYQGGGSTEKIFLEIDYHLYNLLLAVQNGYCPNKKDEEDAIKFVEFIDKMMHFGNKRNELLIHFPNDQRFYRLKRDDFGSFVFERE